MSYMKRHFESHIDEYSDEELIEWGWADSKEDAYFLRECFLSKKEEES